MKGTLLCALAFFCAIGMTSCTKQKRLNKFVSLWRKDKIPYGSYYAFESLSSLFPDAGIDINTASPTTFSYMSSDEPQAARQAYIVLGQRIFAGPDEVEAILRFAAAGHQVFISSLNFSDELLRALHFKIKVDFFHQRNDSLRLSIYEPLRHDSVSYAYPGLALDASFSSFDTAHSQVLGRNELGEPDFIRIAYRNGGAIFIHLAPAAFTNFFLLHKRNKTYYDDAFSYLPKQTTEIYWDDYYRYNNGNDFSALQFLLNNQALRWALWLALMLFVILYLFESKRKQRAQQVIRPPGNPSVDFVKTIGRLYLQQKDNHNLALKMIAAFLEQVRSDYNIPTTALNDDFAKKLAIRSGKATEEIRKLVDDIHEARLQPALSDAELMNLYRQIAQFNHT